MNKTKLSRNPLHYLYAVIWFSLFIAFAAYIFSGKMFLPDANGNISIVAILVAWVAQYLTQVGAGILVLLIGLYVVYKTITVDKNTTNYAS